MAAIRACRLHRHSGICEQGEAECESGFHHARMAPTKLSGNRTEEGPELTVGALCMNYA
jgi:hypothetical protein